MQFNRIMNVKPGSMDKVMKLAPKFPERAKEVLGDDYAGPVKFMVRVHGPLNQVKWQWERESMDVDMAAGMKLNNDSEWQDLVAELS
jgi:hypothetical protein